MVEVVLLERVEHLGQMGDVVNVKPGFARNFLLPQNKALRATKNNLAAFEARKAQLVADNLSRRGDAEAVAKKMEGLSLVLVRQSGGAGQLYGSVSARDIAEATVEAGFTVTRAQVTIDQPIKTIGLHSARISLHPEVSVGVTLSVAPSQDEAEAQLKTGAVAAPEPTETEYEMTVGDHEGVAEE
jgi:large subunit ribosomal protein L9